MRGLIKSEVRYPRLWTPCVSAWCPSVDRSRGTSLTDFSPYRNHGTLTNMASPGTNWVPSNGKMALEFDGVDDSVDIAKSIVPTGSAAKTISLWARSTTTISTRQWLIYAGSETAYGRFCLEIESSKLNLNYFTLGAVHSQTLVNNTWYHFAVTYSEGATSVILYVNGVGETISIFSGQQLNTGATATTRLGVFTTTLFPFAGQMDDIRIYNKALVPSGIATLALRRGIAYETVRNRHVKKAPVGGTFKAAWARKPAQIIGGR